MYLMHVLKRLVLLAIKNMHKIHVKSLFKRNIRFLQKRISKSTLFLRPHCNNSDNVDDSDADDNSTSSNE